MGMQALSAANAMRNSLENAAYTKAVGDTGEFLAERAVVDANQREIRLKRAKEAATWDKVGPNAGVAAATASAQSAER